jgi:hypothetical protein
VPRAKLELQLQLNSRDLKTLREVSGEGHEAQVVERVLHEWLEARRKWGLGPARALDAIVGMFDGPAAAVAEEHDRFGLGADR